MWAFFSFIEHGLAAHLGVLELLLDFTNASLTLFTDEGTPNQFGTDLRRAGNGSGDGHEVADLVCPQIPNGGHHG